MGGLVYKKKYFIIIHNKMKNPHVEQYQETFYGNVHKHKMFRTLSLSTEKFDYRSKVVPKKSTQHWGQRKLFLTELDFLTRYLNHSSNKVLYVGASPGTHLLMILELFPQLELILYDPRNFDKRLKSHPRVTIIHSEELVNIQNLDLSINKLTSISKEMGQLVNLKELNLSENQLISIPKEIGQLVNLQELYLYHNKLTFIPSEIGQLANLKVLNLYGNQLTSIPKEIGQLINLQRVNLSINNFTSIPSELGQLINLKELDLCNNQLTSVPPELGQLINLRVLDLSYNQLTSIPIELDHLKNIKKNNNPRGKSNPPGHILIGGCVLF